MKSISFIVCSNGYGHFKRVMSVAGELINSGGNYKITIFCKEQLRLKTKNWFDSSPNSKIEFQSDLMTNAPEWYNQLSVDEYKKWSINISLNKVLKSSDLIVSDNYVTPLFHFDNVVLMGSFLWHDILSDSSDKDIAAITSLEGEITERKHPLMICLKDMAMKEVVAKTSPVFMPWFCKRIIQEPVKNSTYSILVTAGGTEENDQKIIELVMALNNLKQYSIYTDSKLNTKLRAKGFDTELFSYTEEDFLNLDMIVCRPGIGILTDAVKYGVPIICFGEDSNNEIVHNSKRVEELEIGINISNTPINEIPHILDGLYQSGDLKKFRSNILKLETNGAEVAAKYLKSLL